MTPASFFTGGTAGQQWAETRNRKAPSVAGGAQKISVRGIQRTRNLVGSPAQGGLKNEREAHHSGRAIETAHNDPPKNQNGRPIADLRLRQFNLMTQRFRDRVAHSWPSPPRGDHPLNTTRLNGSCLCAISQLGSYISYRSWPISRSKGCISPALCRKLSPVSFTLYLFSRARRHCGRLLRSGGSNRCQHSRRHTPRNSGAKLVESRCGAVALGCTYLFPPLSSGGALVV
jgi:hypothetical protein